MNVLFFTRRFFPEVGGVETHVLELSKRLIARGHKVKVITQHPMAHKVLSGTIENIDVVRINVKGESWFKKFRIWVELFKKIDFIKNADVIHCHDVFFWFIPFKFIYPKKPVYLTFHGYEGNFPPMRKAVIIRKISEILSMGNICVGDYIHKWYGTKPDFVIYGGVELNQKSKIKKQKHISKLKLVLVGRLERDIGVDTYVKALSLLKKKKLSYDFKVFGEGKLEKKLNKYGKVTGFVDNIGHEMAQSDIVFTSSYLLILQALAAKKIVIAVYENALKEDYLRMSPFANFVYICKDAAEIARVVKYVEKDPWKSAAMVENGNQWAIKQTWDKLSETYLKLWKV